MWRTFKRLKLYIVAIPALLFVFGAGLNQVVMIANHDKFPVMVNTHKTHDKEHPAGYAPGTMLDDEHVVMSDSDRFKFLSDVFDLGSIYSVGDGFIYLGEYLLSFTPFIWIYALCCKVQEDAKYYEE